MGASPEVLALGEPMIELSSLDPGRLRDVRRYQVGWGGDVSNFAVAVARLGGSAGLISRIGDDEFGASLEALWDREGIDHRCVRRVAGEYTGMYLVSRNVQSAHGFTYFRRDSAASHLSPGDVLEDVIADARVLHTSGITQAISTDAGDATFAAIDAAQRHGVLTTYDPNLRIQLWSLDRARAIVFHTLSLVDVAFPSLEEARLLTGLEDPHAIAEAFLGRGAPLIVLKLGADGCLVASAEGMQRLAGYPVNTVDASGAGDTFDAAFVVARLSGQTVEVAADFANAAAALTTTGLGCVTPIPYRAAVEEIRSTRAVSK